MSFDIVKELNRIVKSFAPSSSYKLPLSESQSLLLQCNSSCEISIEAARYLIKSCCKSKDTRKTIIYLTIIDSLISIESFRRVIFSDFLKQLITLGHFKVRVTGKNDYYDLQERIKLLIVIWNQEYNDAQLISIKRYIEESLQISLPSVSTLLSDKSDQTTITHNIKYEKCKQLLSNNYLSNQINDIQVLINSLRDLMRILFPLYDMTEPRDETLFDGHISDLNPNNTIQTSIASNNAKKEDIAWVDEDGEEVAVDSDDGADAGECAGTRLLYMCVKYRTLIFTYTCIYRCYLIRCRVGR